MKFYYAFALYLMTTFSLLAQTEVPLYSNPVLKRAHAIKQQEMAKKWLGNDYIQSRSDMDCAEELPTLNYLTAGEEIDFFVDTFDLDGGGGMITCLNCDDNSLNFGTATLDSTSLRYVSNGGVIAGMDTLLVEFCTANNETCFTFDYRVLVKRAGMSRTDNIVTLSPEESTLYTIDIGELPGSFACASVFDCEDDYEGEPYMWVSQSKPYEFFYEASFYKGTDLVCFIICDEFTICDTVTVPFNIENNTKLQPPFLDDFSYEGPYPDTALWLDFDTYVNTDFSPNFRNTVTVIDTTIVLEDIIVLDTIIIDTILVITTTEVPNPAKINPVSIGMATFDGLDKNGKPYGGGFGKSDQLTSTYIDLEGEGEIYLSFWLQRQGLGDRPEDDDSMQLHFKNSNGEWVDTIRIFDGVASTVSLNEIPEWEFKSVRIEDDFLHDDFQFRFVNLGSRTGALDIWNLNYVRLSANANDNTYNDIALVERPNSILKNYKSMPYTHYKFDELVDELAISFYNHDNTDLPVQNSILSIREKTTDTEVLNIPLSNAVINALLEDYLFQDRAISFNENQFDNIFSTSQKLEFVTSYTVIQTSQDGFGFIPRNDKFNNSTIFDNYFAHDDGTAESNIVAQNFANQSVEIAVQFTANMDDSLRAIQMHIPHVTGNVNSQMFNLKVWTGELDDTPEYEMKFIRPEYLDDYRGDSLQGFTTYPWLNASGDPEEIFIPEGDFYIGWEQAVPCEGTSCLPIGYDKNTPNAARFNFRNRNEEGWEPFPVAIPDGAVMIRPVVGSFTPGPTDVEDIVKTANPIKIFPNPATDRIQLQLLEGNYQDYQLSVFNNTGQLLRQLAMTQELDVTNYQNGIYFLKITNLRTQTISNHKIIVIK